MPRVARVVVPGWPHHVTQRGNNRLDVFFTDDDRRAYLSILAEQCRRYRVAILGYCLMTNHVHLIPVPRADDDDAEDEAGASMAKAIGRTHWLYAQHVNRLHRRSGHLWQNRFYSCPTDRRHALLAVRYSERNPIRAGICRIARRYPWSSAAVHCGAARDEFDLLDLDLWDDLLGGGVDWEAELAVEPTQQEVARLRRAWHTGRPLASDAMLSKLEARLGRRLRPAGRGRNGRR